MQEATNNHENPAIGNVPLADSAINKLKKDINQLRETLEMIEWSIDSNSNNVDLWVNDLPSRVEDVLKHFR